MAYVYDLNISCVESHFVFCYEISLMYRFRVGTSLNIHFYTGVVVVVVLFVVLVCFLNVIIYLFIYLLLLFFGLMKLVYIANHSQDWLFSFFIIVI